MPDYVFYPLAALVLAAMAAVALAPGPERQRQAMEAMGNPRDGLRIQGEALSNLQAPEGLTVDLVQMEDGITAARAASFKRTDQPPLSAGVFLSLPPEFEAAFAGRTVRVSITARRSAADGSEQMRLAYFGGAGAEEGVWREVALTGAWQTYALEWELDPLSGAPGGDYIGIWPDHAGQGRAIDIRGLHAQIAPADGATQPEPGAETAVPQPGPA